MVRVQAEALPDSTWCHALRTTSITAYIENGGTIENAQAIAAANDCGGADAPAASDRGRFDTLPLPVGAQEGANTGCPLSIAMEVCGPTETVQVSGVAPMLAVAKPHRNAQP